MRWSSPLLAAVVLAAVRLAHADCSSGTCIPGGGPTATDCTAEFAGSGLLLNYPPYVPADPQQRCASGTATSSKPSPVKTDSTLPLSLSPCCNEQGE